jgi:predicted  nucleic acid-binding Zn-ribbon protein
MSQNGSTMRQITSRARFQNLTAEANCLNDEARSLTTEANCLNDEARILTAEACCLKSRLEQKKGDVVAW